MKTVFNATIHKISIEIDVMFTQEYLNINVCLSIIKVYVKWLFNVLQLFSNIHTALEPNVLKC